MECLSSNTSQELIVVKSGQLISKDAHKLKLLGYETLPVLLSYLNVGSPAYTRAGAQF